MINEFPAGPDFPEAPAMPTRSLLSRLLSTQTLVLTTTVLVILHSLILLFVGLERFTKRGPEGTEVSLGTFRFEGASDGATDDVTVEFHVHVSLLAKCDRLGRYLLRNHEHRVKQGIEELLRGAANEDFQDPTFADLKRQFQESINRALGERVIAEVILTQVNVTQHGPPASGEQEHGSVAGPEDHTEPIWASTEAATGLKDATPPTSPGDSVTVPNVD